MAKFDFGNNSPQNNSPQVQQTPSQTPTNNLSFNSGKKITVDELLKKLDGNIIPQLKQIQDKLKSGTFQNINKEHKEKLELVLGQYSYLDNKANSGTLLMLLSDIENLEKQFQTDLQKIQDDSEKGRQAIFPNQFIDDDSIKKKLLDVDKLFVNNKMDNKMLAEKILSVNIKSSNLEKSDWDSFFDDLSHAIDPKDRIEFNKAVIEFKKNNELYLKSSGEYKSSRTITKTGTLGVLQSTGNLVMNSKDRLMGVGGLNIENIGSNLDARTHEILALPDTSDNIVVGIGGVQYVFQSKEIALKTIYKTKLILDELSQDSYFMMFINLIFGGIGIDGLFGYILTGALKLGGGYLVLASFESVARNVKDVLSVRLGDKGWSSPVKAFGGVFEGLDKGIKNQNLPYIGKFIKLARILTLPASYVTNLTSSLLSSAEKGTLESMLRDEKVTVVDGLFQYNKNETDNKFEMKQRVKILDFYIKKWKDDPERLSKLDSLTNPRKLVIGGQINSLSETFYLKIWEIDKGQLIITNKGFGTLSKAGNILNGTRNQVGHVFTIPNFKEKIFKEVNDGLINQIEAIKEVYDVKDLGDGKIEIGELNSFYNELKTAVDLDGTIDNADETKRNKLAEEYIKKLKSLEIQGITKERVRQDLVLISEGYLPKYKILEILKVEINRTGLSDDVKKNIQKLIDKVSEGNWIGKESELNTVITNANGSSYSCADKPEHKSKQQIEDRLKYGKSLVKLRFSLEDHNIKTEAEFISFFDNELKMTKMHKDLSSIETINDELRKLFKDMKDCDYTKGHLNYVVQKLLAGETYDNAKTKLSVADFANIDNTHGDKIVLARAIRDNLLTKMETELGTIEIETDINLKEKKLNEFKKKYEITGELETFMKAEGKKYDDIQTRLDKTEKELEKVKYSFDKHDIKSETEFIKSFESELEILKMLKGIDSTRDIEVEMKKLYADISSGNNKTITHLNYIIHELLDGKDYDTVKTSIPTTVDSTHGDREKLKGELGDKLLVEIETVVTSIEGEDDIDKRGELLSNYKERFKISLELEAYLKNLGSKYNAILLRLDKINSKLSLDLKTFVEFEDTGEYKGKAKELVEKAKLVSPGDSDVIEALKDKISLENNKITLVQFENILKGIVIGIDNSGAEKKLGVKDIQTLDFNDYSSEDTKLHQTAKDLKLSDIKTTTVSIEGHGRDVTREATISYVKDAKIEEFMTEWKMYVNREELIKEDINKVNTLKNLKSEVSKIDKKIELLDGEVKNIDLSINSKGNQINRLLSSTIITDDINRQISILNNTNTNLGNEKRSKIDEIRSLNEKNYKLDSEIRLLSKYERITLKSLKEEKIKFENALKVKAETNPYFRDFKGTEPFSIDLIKRFFESKIKTGKFLR